MLVQPIEHIVHVAPRFRTRLFTGQRSLDHNMRHGASGVDPEGAGPRHRITHRLRAWAAHPSAVSGERDSRRPVRGRDFAVAGSREHWPFGRGQQPVDALFRQLAVPGLGHAPEGIVQGPIREQARAALIIGKVVVQHRAIRRADQARPGLDAEAIGCVTRTGALEPQFYRLLVEKCGLADEGFAQAQFDVARWPELKERMKAFFRTRTRAEWCELLEGSDVCFAPVLSLAEAARHPHNVARGIYRTDAKGDLQVAAAPRFEALVGGARTATASV